MAETPNDPIWRWNRTEVPVVIFGGGSRALIAAGIRGG
jgi:hypothetical protein